MLASEQIAFLFQEHLGGSWEPLDVQEMIEDPDSCVLYHTEVPVGCAHQKVIAAATARMLRLEETGWYHMPYPCGFLESALVLPEYRGKGIGKQLLQARMSWFRLKGVQTVCALAWESRQERTSRPLLEAAGFALVEIIEKPWWEEGCPICGQSCQCNAALMRKDLESRGRD